MSHNECFFLGFTTVQGHDGPTVHHGHHKCSTVWRLVKYVRVGADFFKKATFALILEDAVCQRSFDPFSIISYSYKKGHTYEQTVLGNRTCKLKEKM